MAGRAFRITARILFFVCGVISLLIGWLFAIKQGEDLPVYWEWILFVVALGLIGGCAVLAAVLPRAWIGKACNRERSDDSLISVPFKLLGGFASIFYVIAVAEMFVPHTWRLNPQILLALCPLYIVRIIIDPAPALIFLLFAPMNAAIYGSLGVTLGYLRLRLRRPTEKFGPSRRSPKP